MGLQMSISGISQRHRGACHANLLGWVTMALFGGFYALNPAKAQSRLALVQYGVYTVGVVIIGPGPLFDARRQPGLRAARGRGIDDRLPWVSSCSLFWLFAPDRQQSARTSHPRSR